MQDDMTDDLADELDVRDWFAGHALAGIMAHPDNDGARWSLIAQNAYFAADAMMAERAKRKAQE